MSLTWRELFQHPDGRGIVSARRPGFWSKEVLLMQDESNRPPEMDAQLKRALSHPRRQEVFSYIMKKGDGTRTDEREIADALGLTVPKVKYHLMVLHDADLIAIDEGQGQGETERSFIASASLASMCPRVPRSPCG